MPDRPAGARTTASASASARSPTRARSVSNRVASGLCGLGLSRRAGDAQQLHRWRLQQDRAQITQPGPGAVLPADALLAERLEGVQSGQDQLVLERGAALRSRQRDQQPRLQSLPSRGFDLLPQERQGPLSIDRLDAVRKARDDTSITSGGDAAGRTWQGRIGADDAGADGSRSRIRPRRARAATVSLDSSDPGLRRELSEQRLNSGRHP